MGTRLLVGSVVKVEFTSKKHCTQNDVVGLLWNVDPETGCCIVLTKQEDKREGNYKVITCFSHGITSINKHSVSDNEETLFKDFGSNLSTVISRRNAPTLSLSVVEERLSAARLPFKVDSVGDISVFDDAAIIRPPYSKETVESQNDQILSSIIKLLT